MLYDMRQVQLHMCLADRSVTLDTALVATHRTNIIFFLGRTREHLTEHCEKLRLIHCLATTYLDLLHLCLLQSIIKAVNHGEDAQEFGVGDASANCPSRFSKIGPPLRITKRKGKEEYLCSAFLHQGTHKALRHGSHSFTCK